MFDAACDAGPLFSIVWGNFLASGWFLHLADSCYLSRSAEGVFLFSQLPTVTFFPVPFFPTFPLFLFSCHLIHTAIQMNCSLLSSFFFPTCPLLLSFLFLFFLLLFCPTWNCYFLSCYLFSFYFLCVHPWAQGEWIFTHIRDTFPANELQWVGMGLKQRWLFSTKTVWGTCSINYQWSPDIVSILIRFNQTFFVEINWTKSIIFSKDLGKWLGMFCLSCRIPNRRWFPRLHVHNY